MADVNVNLYLDCSDKLAGLVEKVTTAFGRPVVKEEVKTVVAEKINNTYKKAVDALEEKSEKKEEAPEVITAPVEVAPVASEDHAEEAPELSESDIRDKMNEVFARLEEGIEDGDKKKKIHKEIVAVMKEGAKSLGFDKPSAIDNFADRWRFAGILEGIRIVNDKVVPF